VRVDAGKSATGRVRVLASRRGDEVEVLIDDDGAGVDFTAVRKRAEDLGLRRAHRAGRDSETELLQLLLQPSFSTKDVATTTSGRGVGLDAVRTAVSRHGGRITVESKDIGTLVRLRLPQDRQEMTVHHFRCPRTELLLAVPSVWSTTVGPATDAATDVVDAMGLKLASTGGQTPSASLQGRMGTARFSWAIKGDVSTSVAERLCPTAATEPMEIVLLGEGEAVLLRPERITPS